ncbi:GMC family oxidoreductase [Sphingomonas sp. So64.6b]|uniref:FAD-dependent oxidoreductase n=1 Tax=Sphingomonas sp. So64.6b TaxID=2997354 RepID=UPI001601DA44|nr:FAD-dependent oxidoreductase [Sphingomonas sp. So64.6b]QNA83104.1 GMC family oxidoreductase [Sphingomonas sp. So64.6b]
MHKPFNFVQAAILKAMTEALFHGVEMKIPSSQVVANIQHQFGMVTGGKPTQIGLSLYLICLVMGGPFFLLFGPAWGARRVEKRLHMSRNNLMQDLARTRGIIYAGYYGHWDGVSEDDNRNNVVLASIGFTLPAHRMRTLSEVPIAPFPGRELGHDDILRPDQVPVSAGVIVIGSGAGGAVAAANLAAQGHDVLIIEAGAHFPSSAITHEERKMTARLFVDGGVQTSRDNDVVLFQGRCVGGSTAINNGICLRVKQDGLTHPAARDVFASWAALGGPVDEARFVHAYEAVEARLGIEPIDPQSGRNNGTHLLRGWAAHAAASDDPLDRDAVATWFSKNYGPRSIGAACAYCGYCNTGCPYGRKQGMAQSYLLDARRSGAQILADTTVERVRWRPGLADGKRVADGVEITLADGRTHFVRATTGVVVAAGAMASSRLMAASDVGNSGNGISLNIACPVVALMPEGTGIAGEMRSWDEDQMATYVDRGDFLLESHFQPPMSMSTLMPGWFDTHAARMRHYGRLASAGVLFPVDRQGSMKGGKLHLKFRDDVELPLLRRALSTLVRVHFAAGAIEVYPGLARGQALRPDDDVEAFFEEAIQAADDVVLSSSHPHGGNARNADPDKGVVDLECRLHGVSNVLVTDASTFTSCIRVNAQLTTMAMAQYATSRDPFARA